ncbi:MAG TPA: signal peptidase II [Gemmatimonadaceae bacterium]|nr:signal peptidase II [Gemmatimonadaceae bacterium]
MTTLLIGVIVAVLVDFTTKRFAKLVLMERPIPIMGVIQLRHVRSRRRLYDSESIRVLLTGVWLAAFGSTLLLHASGALFQRPSALAGIGAALGGAGGNLLEILHRRRVTDFIDLGWWPSFNVADAAIVIGLVIAFWPGP